ncbi:MAG: response regulator [Cytophagaceae bacterium]
MKKYTSVLLIDDNSMDLMIGKAVIEFSQITKNIMTARNGMDALNQLTKYYLKHKTLPELLLVDLIMPMMDGFKFIDEVYRFPFYFRSNTKIIVLTACPENEEDIKKLNDLGIKDVLLKPLDKEDLIKAIAT